MITQGTHSLKQFCFECLLYPRLYAESWGYKGEQKAVGLALMGPAI